MKFGVVIFPGSNCDRDALHVTSQLPDSTSVPLWHKDTTLPEGIDCVILPGGFSFGDYLRCGAIARFSPIMREIVRFAERGGYVLGICNGFQILTEANLLPGALLKNTSLRFVCRDVYLKVDNTHTAFSNAVSKTVLRVPIAHGEGNFFADNNTVEELEAENRVVLRYCDAQGNITREANPNGSLKNIAGIVNRKGNVFGMMPHPERAADVVLGNTDGIEIFTSLLQH
jgi:phosphoribosylformylglycinamidine synthase subunit PurQ / glutaminase